VRKAIGLACAIGFVAATVVAVPTVGAASRAATATDTGTGTATVTENPAANAGSVAWGKCSDATLVKYKAQCGVVRVPVDYSKPGGARVALAVSRVRHTVPDSKFQGVMLVNPGGPGGSGLIYSILTNFVPNGAGASYDWIGFDPRGVGASQDALSCIPNYFGYDRPNYVPTTKKLEQIWLDRSRSYSAACARKNNPALLRNLTTEDSARDMDSIRQALGQSQINYYGFSYGTYLAQVYSTLFPQRVRRMVLDSNVDPRGVWYQAQLDQDRAFDANMDVYFAWIAKYHAVFHLGTSGAAVKALYYRTQAALDVRAAGGIIGGDELNDVFLGAGYYIYDWVDIAQAFADYVHHGVWKPLKALYDSASGIGDDNGFAVYLGVQCTDAHWPQNYATWRADSWRVYATAPFLTWNNTWFNAPCLTWPAPSGQPVKIDGSKVPPILLLDETKDAATPFEGSLEVRSLFPRSSLIASPGGTTHAASLSGVSCVDDQVAGYLATGRLPARKAGPGPDALCAPLAPPVPKAAASAAAATTVTADALATTALRRLLVPTVAGRRAGA
jgi:pimeloyl-ACP methyl ester carboxylesterase